eukprot:TRINITY_DN15218_c0_g1_i1.p1 TRINITY_DN15218_c0_g1~~TRINITY_DN15218_c0_g1_i1.p1  ORF type:complete len:484 (+),score=135.44 TRINITY_DN15218_c0_g1_i1:62-1513(+)
MVEGRPNLDSKDLPELLQNFGLSAEGASFKELPAFEDCNLLVTTQDGAKYVLKAHNALLPSGTLQRLEAQDRIIRRLRQQGLPVPEVLVGASGDSIVALEAPAPGQPVPHARVLTYLEGTTIPNEVPKDAAFLQRVGNLTGQVANALSGFEDPGAHWTWDWDMKRVPEVVRSKLNFMKDERRRSLASRLADEYEVALKHASTLPHSVLHADLNDTNLLFDGDEIVGIIDFGDSIYNCRAFEPAIAAGYYSLAQEDPLLVFCEVLRGYLSSAHSAFSEDELLAYFYAARGRILLSVSFAAENMSLEPDNEYLAHTAEPGWAVLEKLEAVSEQEALAKLREVAADVTEQQALAQLREVAAGATGELDAGISMAAPAVSTAMPRTLPVTASTYSMPAAVPMQAAAYPRLDHSQGKWFMADEALPAGFVAVAHPDGLRAPQQGHLMSARASQSFRMSTTSAEAARSLVSTSKKATKKTKKKKSAGCC